MSEKLKKINSVEGPLRKLRFCKWATPKMQQIMKQVGPSRQLFETVNRVIHSYVVNDKIDIFLLFWPDSESFGK